jgi:glycosyltransferase involved in cell wall biosynthesis
MNVNQVVVAIDASRNRSGGAKAHLIGILNAVSPQHHGIDQVHLWSYAELLDQIPDFPWLVKHSPEALRGSLLKQIWWQYAKLPQELKDAGCQALLSTDAGTVCHFVPDIVMSRDMLSFEGQEMQRYPLLSFSRLRLWLLKWIQVRSLRLATGSLFLTQYAADVIQKFSGPLKGYRVIPHGIGDEFRRQTPMPESSGQPVEVRCVYVSNADLYKHQWNVIEAISQLRDLGLNLRLDLVGAGSGAAVDLVEKAVEQFDPDGQFVHVHPAQKHQKIAEFLMNADLFIFASSCENMPNTLVEAMAAGLPIACSDRGPMPEVLKTSGVYFNPEIPSSIAKAVRNIIDNPNLRRDIASSALERSQLFSWRRCAKETWTYLLDVRNASSR